MQTELLRGVTPPPSYEESVYFKQLIDQIKTQRRKTPPPCYDSKQIFEWVEKPPLGDYKSIPKSDPKSIPAASETSYSSDNEDVEPIHERLERVSSSLLQMIDAAKKSLTTTTDTTVDSKDEDTFSHQLTLKKQSINRKKSLERLRSSQTSLARTMDQLNISITQHVITTNYTHHDEHQHHHHHQYQHQHHHQHQHIHHHHHHHHYQKRPSSSTPRKPTVPVWTNLLSQTALVFSICHHLFSWSKSSSSLASAVWLISLLYSKKKFKRSPGSLLTLFRSQ